MPIDVTLSPEVAAVVRETEDRRFTRGALKSAVRWAADDAVTAATIVELTLDSDPPRLVAELLPGGRRPVLYAGESGWTLAPERVRRVEVPAGVWELDWLQDVLVETAATLGADVAGATPPEIAWTSEELGQGETRRTAFVAWDVGAVRVTARVDEHEIYDGATPRWGHLRGTIEGLPAGVSILVTASLSVDGRTATVTVSEPRSTSPWGGGR